MFECALLLCLQFDCVGAQTCHTDTLYDNVCKIQYTTIHVRAVLCCMRTGEHSVSCSEQANMDNSMTYGADGII